MNSPIHHVWFDFSETLVFLKRARHSRLRYESYAELVGRPVDDTLVADYEACYEQSEHSNAAVFQSLGQPADYWASRVASVPPGELYELADPAIPAILTRLKGIVPISIFSNIHVEPLLPALGINPGWFTHIVSAGMVARSKPALDGFYLMVQLSQRPAGEIRVKGNSVEVFRSLFRSEEHRREAVFPCER